MLLGKTDLTPLRVGLLRARAEARFSTNRQFFMTHSVSEAIPCAATMSEGQGLVWCFFRSSFLPSAPSSPEVAVLGEQSAGKRGQPHVVNSLAPSRGRMSLNAIMRANTPDPSSVINPTESLPALSLSCQLGQHPINGCPIPLLSRLVSAILDIQQTPEFDRAAGHRIIQFLTENKVLGFSHNH
jgi:hypothetical protein